jgi:predicted MFS family arabinose efflux permease
MLRALGPFAAGYFTSYLFRVVNAAISDDLVAELSLSNTDLGLMTSMYLYGFVLFQLPLGLLLDRFGPRLVQTGLLTVAALGAGLFALGSNTVELAGARLLIGVGLGGCLMSAFKANAMWLPPERLALGNSAVVTFGGLGFLAGTYPANLAADLIGWRALFLVLVGFTLAVTATIYLLVPKRDDDHHPVAFRTQLKGYVDIFRDGIFWRVTPMVATISGTFIAVQTLWATRWMGDVAGLERHDAGQQLMILGLAFAVGSLTTGFIADAAQRRGLHAIRRRPARHDLRFARGTTTHLAGLWLYRAGRQSGLRDARCPFWQAARRPGAIGSQSVAVSGVRLVPVIDRLGARSSER